MSSEQSSEESQRQQIGRILDVADSIHDFIKPHANKNDRCAWRKEGEFEPVLKHLTNAYSDLVTTNGTDIVLLRKVTKKLSLIDLAGYSDYEDYVMFEWFKQFERLIEGVEQRRVRITPQNIQRLFLDETIYIVKDAWGSDTFYDTASQQTQSNKFEFVRITANEWDAALRFDKFPYHDNLKVQSFEPVGETGQSIYFKSVKSNEACSKHDIVLKYGTNELKIGFRLIKFINTSVSTLCSIGMNVETAQKEDIKNIVNSQIFKYKKKDLKTDGVWSQIVNNIYKYFMSDDEKSFEYKNLFNLKRSGDYGQIGHVKALNDTNTKVYLATFDRLCYVRAKFEGVPCIRVQDTTIDIFHGKPKNIDESIDNMFKQVDELKKELQLLLVQTCAHESNMQLLQIDMQTGSKLEESTWFEVIANENTSIAKALNDAHKKIKSNLEQLVNLHVQATNKVLKQAFNNVKDKKCSTYDSFEIKINDLKSQWNEAKTTTNDRHKHEIKTELSNLMNEFNEKINFSNLSFSYSKLKGAKLEWTTRIECISKVIGDDVNCHDIELHTDDDIKTHLLNVGITAFLSKGNVIKTFLETPLDSLDILMKLRDAEAIKKYNCIKYIIQRIYSFADQIQKSTARTNELNKLVKHFEDITNLTFSKYIEKYGLDQIEEAGASGSNTHDDVTSGGSPGQNEGNLDLIDLVDHSFFEAALKIEEERENNIDDYLDDDKYNQQLVDKAKDYFKSYEELEKRTDKDKELYFNAFCKARIAYQSNKEKCQNAIRDYVISLKKLEQKETTEQKKSEILHLFTEERIEFMDVDNVKHKRLLPETIETHDRAKTPRKDMPPARFYPSPASSHDSLRTPPSPTSSGLQSYSRVSYNPSQTSEQTEVHSQSTLYSHHPSPASSYHGSIENPASTTSSPASSGLQSYANNRKSKEADDGITSPVFDSYIDADDLYYIVQLESILQEASLKDSTVVPSGGRSLSPPPSFFTYSRPNCLRTILKCQKTCTSRVLSKLMNRRTTTKKNANR